MQDILLNVLMFLIKNLSKLFLTPVIALVTSFIPDVSTYIISAKTFLTDYVFKGALFVKQIFINCTGVSQTVLTALFTYLLLKVSFYLAMQTTKLIIKIWKLVKP